MCFSSSPSYETPEYTAAAPTPTTVQSKESGAVSQEERRKKLQSMRSGLASTISSSSAGVVGKSSDLLQSAALSAGKTKLGQ